MPIVGSVERLPSGITPMVGGSEEHLLSWDCARVIPIEFAGDHRRAASG
jgi:hypothetical protein